MAIQSVYLLSSRLLLTQLDTDSNDRANTSFLSYCFYDERIRGMDAEKKREINILTGLSRYFIL